MINSTLNTSVIVDGVWWCSICEMAFPFKSRLERHLKTSKKHSAIAGITSQNEIPPVNSHLLANVDVDVEVKLLHLNLFKCAILTTCISLNLQNIHGEENGSIEDIGHDDDSAYADDVHCSDDDEEEDESLSDEECGMLIIYMC